MLTITATSDDKRSETQGRSREATLKEGRSEKASAQTETDTEAWCGRSAC